MKRLVACVAALAVLLLTPSTAVAAVSSKPMVAAMFNDTVRAVAYRNGIYFVGGAFSQASDAGLLVTRTGLAAVSSNGALVAFQPAIDGEVYALATTDEYLYICGTFSTVNGVAMRRVARFNLADYTLDRNFQVAIDTLPRSLEVSGSRLYIGGDFNSVSGKKRSKLAAVSTKTGALISAFSPSFDKGVRGLEAADGRLYVGGGFTKVNGAARKYLVALNPETGKTDKGFSAKAHGTVFDIDAAGKRVYVAAGGGGGAVASYSESGSKQWERLVDGDITAVVATGGNIYAGGHFENVCGAKAKSWKCPTSDQTTRRKLFAVSSGDKLLSWNPDGDSSIGVYGLAAGSGTVAAGGTFHGFGGGAYLSERFVLFGS